MCIKALADSSNSMGETVSEKVQSDVILEGLPIEYETLIPLTNSKPEVFDFAEIESLLAALENRIEMFKQLGEPMIFNIS